VQRPEAARKRWRIARFKKSAVNWKRNGCLDTPIC